MNIVYMYVWCIVRWASSAIFDFQLSTRFSIFVDLYSRFSILNSIFDFRRVVFSILIAILDFRRLVFSLLDSDVYSHFSILTCILVPRFSLLDSDILKSHFHTPTRKVGGAMHVRVHGMPCVDQAGFMNVTAAGVGWPGDISETSKYMCYYVLGEFIHLLFDCLLAPIC